MPVTIVVQRPTIRIVVATPAVRVSVGAAPSATAEIADAIAAHEAEADPHPQYVTADEVADLVPPGAGAIEVVRLGASGDGVSTSDAAVPDDARVWLLFVLVEDAFDGTLAIGWSDDATALSARLPVALDPATLAGTGPFATEIPALLNVVPTGTRQLVVTASGGPTTGQVRVTAHHVIPET